MTTLRVEHPYAVTVATDKMGKICSKCFSNESDLMCCEHCGFLHYCSRVCQMADWTDHKRECAIINREVQQCKTSDDDARDYSKVPSARIRLMIRVYFKFKSLDLGSSFNGRCLSDLVDHRDRIRRKESSYDDVCKLAKMLECDSSLPTPCREEVLVMYGKVETNCLTIFDDSFKELGEGLYFGLSIHDHSCRPDAHVIFVENMAMLRSFDINTSYSSDLKISYVNVAQHTVNRRKQLKDRWFFTCHCPVCEDAKWEGSSRGVRCTNCGNGSCPLNDRGALICASCGIETSITVDNALLKNRQLEHFLQNEGTPQLMYEFLLDVILFYQEASEILSSKNLSLGLLAERIMFATGARNHQIDEIKYAIIAVDILRNFEHFACPTMTYRLGVAARAIENYTVENQIDEKRLDIMNEAVESARICFGPDHLTFLRIRSIRARYFKRIQYKTND